MIACSNRHKIIDYDFQSGYVEIELKKFSKLNVEVNFNFIVGTDERSLMDYHEELEDQNFASILLFRYFDLE